MLCIWHIFAFCNKKQDMHSEKSNKDFDIRWKSQIKKGLIEYIILLLLEKKTYYGYELLDKISEVSSIEIAEGTLYPLLNRLKKEDLVTSKWQEMDSGIPRKYYTISKKGVDQIVIMNEYFIGIQSSLARIRKSKN